MKVQGKVSTHKNFNSVYKIFSFGSSLSRLGLNKMRISYDPRYNIAYICLMTKSSDVESIRISDELIVDMTPDGTIYGFELLNANEQLQRDDMGKLMVINEATGKQIDIALSIQ
jgi:uncharacterized protein YuzE